MGMTNTRDVIAALGGVNKISQETGIPYTTIYTWSRKGSIPAWRRDVLNALAEKAGVAIRL